jgi:hypothetical protein
MRAAGYNLRWLIRAVLRGRIKPLFWPLWLRAWLAYWPLSTATARSGAQFGPRHLSRTPPAWEAQTLPTAA